MQPVPPPVSEMPSPLPVEVEEPTPLGAGIDFTDPNSPLAPYYLQASDVWAVVLLSLLLIILNLAPLWHTDVWGHLKFGKWIVSNGRFPTSATFCDHEDPQLPFRTVYWLAQSGLYLVYHAGEVLLGPDPTRAMQGGVECLRSLHALLCVLRLLVLWLAFRRLTSSPLLALVGLILTIGLSIGHAAVLRPQVIGELFFACLLLALSRPVLSRQALWLIPAALVIWANCHGSYVVGLSLLGLCLVGRAVTASGLTGLVLPWKAWQDAQVRRLFLVLVASLGLIAVLNPSGPMLFWNTIQMARYPNVQTMDEWQPLDLRLSSGGAWFYFATLAVVGITQLLGPRWFSATQLLLVLFFGVQPCLHQRAMIWWLVVAPWVAVPHWSAIAERFRHWPASLRSTPSFRKTLIAGAVALMAISWLHPIGWLLGQQPTPLPRSLSSGTPWQLKAGLLGSTPAGEPQNPLLPPDVFQDYPEGRFVGRIFASEMLGDYLLWSLPADQKLMIYTHVHLFPPMHWRDCLLIKFGTEEGKAVLDREGINLIIVEAEMHPHLRTLLQHLPDWTICLDETGLKAKRDMRCRLLVAVRKKPIEPETKE